MLKTLIVDDEKIVRKGIMAVLPWDKFNMKVIGEAANGEKALEFIRDNEVDLLFTDISMPVMSGFDLIREVRKNHPKIWIVVLTCHQDFNYIQEVLRLGAIDYIVKTQLELEPVEDILGRIVQRITSERSDNKISAADVPQLRPKCSQKYSEEVVNCIMNSVEYIKCNLTKGINQDDAAKKANMSRGYFSQCFKDIMGQSFLDYIKEAKMQKAKELLLESNKHVYWIAEQLGFQDGKYFSRIFREYTGLLPTEYRSRSGA